MNEFLEFFKRLFGLSEEQVQKAEKELKIIEKTETEPKETAPNQETEKEKTKTTEDVENTTEIKETDKPTGLEGQSANATSNTEGVEETVSKEEYQKLQEELVAVKAILESTKAEQAKEKRNTAIKSIKDCVDYDYLTTLLEGVEEKDFESKVEEIKKDKTYLFKTTETKGFNPATPSSTLNGVEEAFFKNNPDLRTQL